MFTRGHYHKHESFVSAATLGVYTRFFPTLTEQSARGNRIKRGKKGRDTERKLPVVARSDSDHPSRSDEIPRLGIVKKKSSRERLKEKRKKRS